MLSVVSKYTIKFKRHNGREVGHIETARMAALVSDSMGIVPGKLGVHGHELVWSQRDIYS